jgi:hypothetical protein
MKALGSEYLDRQDGILAAEEQSWRRGAMRPTSTRTGVGLIPPRAPTNPSMVDTPSQVSQTSMPLPIAPPKRGVYSLVALLSVLVVALAVGIVLVVTSKSPTRTADAAPASLVQPTAANVPPAVPPQPPAPAAAAAKPSMSTTPTTITTNPPARPDVRAEPPKAEKSELAIGNVEIQSVTPPPAPPPAAAPPKPVQAVAPRPAAPVWRAPPPPPPKKVAAPTPAVKAPTEVAKPDPAPAVSPPPPAAPAATANCSPPYYYEGTKKVFKPACL